MDILGGYKSEEDKEVVVKSGEESCVRGLLYDTKNCVSNSIKLRKVVSNNLIRL